MDRYKNIKDMYYIMSLENFEISLNVFVIYDFL